VRAYFLNFNNTWIPVGADALEAQHQRKVKLNQVEHERLSGKTAAPGPKLVQLGWKVSIARRELLGAATFIVIGVALIALAPAKPMRQPTETVSAAA
jgi:hypothetical protein